MKKLLLSLFAIFAAVASGFATETTFNFGDPALYGYALPPSGTGTNLADGTITAGNIVITSKKGNSNNDNRFWLNTDGSIEFRGYTGSSLTFQTTDGSNISSMVLTGAKTGTDLFTFQTGTYVSPEWTGSASEVVMTFTGTVNISSIVVTTVAPGEVVVDAPKFNPTGGVYYEAQNVAISCATQNASIYYTLDGTEPTASSTLYTNPINIAQTTTLKAIAILGDVKSTISEAYYSIESITKVASITEFYTLATGTMVEFTCPLTVTYQGTNQSGSSHYLFVTDGQNAMQIFGNLSRAYVNGDVIPAGVQGKMGVYGGAKQLGSPVAATFVAPTANNPVNPQNVTVEEAGGDTGLYCYYVKIANATVDATAKTLSDGTSSVAIYNRFKDITIPTDTENKYDVVAIMNIYNGGVQVFPISFEVVTGIENVDANAVSVVAGYGQIEINSADNAQVVVVNAMGQMVANKTVGAGASNVAAAPGFYIVKVGNAVTKVVVK